MSSNNIGRLITKTTTTLQHISTLHHTSPNYTSVHLSALHFLSFTLHYIYISYRSVTTHITRHHTVLISKFISKIMNPFTAVKNFSPFHFTSIFIYLFFYYFYFYALSSELSMLCTCLLGENVFFVWIQNGIKYYTVQCVVYFVRKHRMKFST